MSDWFGRYLRCDSNNVVFLHVEKRPFKDKCVHRDRNKRICNPCNRLTKIAFVAESDEAVSLNLRLPFNKLRETGESFMDDAGNMYEFASHSEFNKEFDSKFPSRITDNYDTTHLYKYFVAY